MKNGAITDMGETFLPSKIPSTTEKMNLMAEKIKNDIAKILPTADISLSKVDDRSAGNYHGSFSIYYPKLLQHTLRVKLASLLPPAWHLDFEK